MNGDYRRAFPLHEECLSKKNRIPGHDNLSMLITLYCTAVSLYFMGECDRALLLLEECLAKRKRTLGDVKKITTPTPKAPSIRATCALKCSLQARRCDTGM
jgi:hypothetical protein